MQTEVEFSIKALTQDGSDLTKPAELVLQNWAQLQALLPADLEARAASTGALQRRRGVRQAVDLLRLLLVYAVCDWSLRLVGAWATLLGVAELSDVAILNRFRHSSAWLGHLIGQLLKSGLTLRPQPGWRLRVIDATSLSEPGSRGTDWRVHLSLDLGQMGLDHIAVTDAKGAEKLARFASQPGDIEVADRGYAYASGLGPVLAAKAHVVVRTRWQNPSLNAQGQRFDIVAWLKANSSQLASGPQSLAVQLPTPQGCFAMRLIAAALPQEAADRARARARKKSAKQGLTPDERSLFVAGYILILTNLPEDAWPAAQVLALYRLRWQIEMYIKRLKSILALDALRARSGQLAQTYLLAKLLAALLLERLTQPTVQQVPAWLRSTQHPLSPWRLTMLAWDHLRDLVRGVLPWHAWADSWPKLQRYLCDSPRKRRQQWASILTLLSTLSSC